MSLFDKIKSAFVKDKEAQKYEEGLAKTRKEFSTELSSLSKKYKNIDDDYFEELENTLIMADIGVNTVVKFVDKLKKRVKEEKIKDTETLKEIIIDELLIMYVDSGVLKSKINYSSEGPTVILFIGVNGVGKTTSIGKIASKLKKEGKKVLLVAGDTFRAGAIEQIKEWGEREKIDVVSTESKDPSAAVYDGIDKGIKGEYDVILIDTAGRLHIDDNLMEELQNIKQEVKPEETLLVIDSMMGQDAINVITGFNSKIDLTGVILTKLDGDTRGGVALSVRHLTNVPIKFIGDSEKMDGISYFYPDRMASRILGMGDILSIVDKANEVIDEKEAEKSLKKMQKGKFDLEDFLSQMKQIKKLGPLENLLKLIPGASKMGLNNVNINPKDLAHIEAIILSMTPYERKHPEILKASRKERIAKGSGRNVMEVNRLLTQFEQSKKMMKMISNGNMKLPF